MVASEQRHGDAVEALLLGEVVLVGVHVAEERSHAHESGQRAREQHGDEDHSLWVNPRHPRRTGVAPRRPQPEAEACLPHDHPEEDQHSDGDEQHAVESTIDEVGEPRRPREFLRLDEQAFGRAVDPEESVEGPRHETEGDEVEHDRRDHLVHTALHLQPAGDSRPDGAGDHGHHETQRDVERCRQIDGGSDDGRGEQSDAHLTLDTDVEEVHLESDGHGRRRDHERGGAIERSLNDLHVAGRAEQRAERLDGVLAGDEEDDR